jgi:hypothetical protein
MEGLCKDFTDRRKRMKRNGLTLEEIGWGDAKAIKEIGCHHGIYFRNRNPEINLSTPIFRYMKLGHLISLVDNKSLYIPNRSAFTDLRDKIGFEKISLENIRSSGLEVAESYKNMKEIRAWREYKDKAFHVCISCWTTDRRGPDTVDENFLMWKAYSASNDITCRVKTTIKDFVDSIEDLSCDIAVSDVFYNEGGNRYDRLIFGKSIYYESEQEIRVVALSNDNHVEVKIDPYRLIQEIKTSPFVIPPVEGSIINMLKKRYPQLEKVIFPSNVMEYANAN